VTICTHEPVVYAGLGVRFEVRRMDGEIAHVHYWHPRPDGAGECEGCISLKPRWDDGWDLIQEAPLTVSPSLLCRACGHHGHIKGGRWEPAT
jgi:hypothetical protein